MKNAHPLSICNNRERFTKNRRKKQKRGWECECGFFGIWKLPDEILIVILSCLTLKEATRTSVLCRRWRYLWRYTSGSLDFHFDDFVKPKKSNVNVTEIEEQQQQPDTLVNRSRNLDLEFHGVYSDSFGLKVDQILKLHRSPSVDKFIVSCPRMPHFPDHITNWVRFAMQKEVSVFEINLATYGGFPDLHKFMSISRAVKPEEMNGLSSLTSLTLVGLNIKDQMIEFLLSNSPLLQHLCLKDVWGLKKLNVNAAASSLKSLIIEFCIFLRDLTISAPNLVSFKYDGEPGRQIEFENVPLLSDLTLIGAAGCRNFLHLPSWSSKYRNQLEKLTLHLPYLVTAEWPESVISFNSCFLGLQRLKHLELVLDTVDTVSFLHFLLFTKACPFLSTFVLQFIHKISRSSSRKLRKNFALHSSAHDHAQEALKAHSHEYLKVVKLMNMAFYRSEFRFALSLIQIAKSVEKVIIKPSPHKERIAIARERVKQLKAILPPCAQLMIML